MKNKYLLLSACTFILLTGCMKEVKEETPANQPFQTPQSSDEVFMGAANQNTNGARKHVPNELLVKFKTGLSEEVRDAVLARIGGSINEKILTRAMERFGEKEGVYLVHTPLAVLDAISQMKGIEIEYAEPNYVYTYGATTSNDSYFTGGQLWGMYSSTSPSGTTDPTNTYGCHANTAWKAGHTGSNTVYIGIIDEGAMWNHEDLSGNFGNPNEIAGNNKDDDGNGYKDDTYGWDFVSNDNSTFDGTGDDHGTHVAGTIGAKGGNSIGVAGVCWNVKMLSAKFLGPNGGTTANAIKAVDYFTDLKKNHGLNIVATNNSWGGGGYSQALYDAIKRAGDANILFIAAAGNDGRNTDDSPSYPASYNLDNIISVAAITSTGDIASWSNYGATAVDIGAPGSGIYSTLPVKKGKNVSSGYGSYSGTSMATPHVTGAAALYASTHSGASATAIKNAILSSAVLTESLNSKCVTGGRLNVSGF